MSIYTHTQTQTHNTDLDYFKAFKLPNPCFLINIYFLLNQAHTHKLTQRYSLSSLQHVSANLTFM